MTAVPSHLLPHRTPAQLLAMARQGLAEADSQHDGLRYSTAHLAAVRAAAAMLAARATPVHDRRRSPAVSVWQLLIQVAPECAGWADYFAGTSTTRAAAEAGIPHVVTARDADRMVEVAGQWVGVVGMALGVPR
jgi:hypothetical protein